MTKSPKTPSITATDDNADIHPAARPFLWLGKPSVIKNFIWLPAGGMVITSILGWFFPQHHEAPWDFFFSWALIGFIAYSFIVISAGPLFKFLARDENYYGEGGLPDPEYSTEGSHHHD
jgi:hypothetical protein